MYKGHQAKILVTLRVLQSFTADTGRSQPPIIYSSFLGVKNVRSVPKIMEIKVSRINTHLINGPEMYFQEINAS